ncbi:SRPBCC family protein [Streptomyces sp. CAU 1734]|uniref:SRPBCC family protein n=1 Tax=Streptomyces sp. CAU 1734 TaxID=3140360 RepID=UPI0032601563
MPHEPDPAGSGDRDDDLIARSADFTAELETAADGRRTVLRMTRSLPHPPEPIWNALTRPVPLSRWFPTGVTVDPRPGGTIRFVFPGDTEPGMTGTVTDAEEPRLLAFTWGADHLRWEITPRGGGGSDLTPQDGGGSDLTLTHTFDDHAGAASHAAGWQICVTGLAQLLDGEEITAERDTRGALHEAYIARFRLNQGVIETTGDGWCVRFDRQLIRPAERVWSELTAGTTPLLGGPAPRGFTTPVTPSGPVTALRPPLLLAYRPAPGSEVRGVRGVRGVREVREVRWELAEGTGHGARLTLTERGEAGEDPREVLGAWRVRIDRLATGLLAG